MRRRLGVCVDEYLAHRRSFGYGLRANGRVLADFVRFAHKVNHRGYLTTEVMMRWATKCPDHSPRYQAARLSIVRGFARYLAARDGRTEVPEQNRLPDRFRREQPHIFNDIQLDQLVKLAEALPSIEPFRPASYAVVLGLLACTGIRISEALALQIDDVDLARGLLHIRETKFHKSRLVPMHPSTTTAMGRYQTRRNKDSDRRSSRWFFTTRHARPLSYASIWYALRRVCSQQGWRGNGDRPFPRIHDLRHTFAGRSRVSGGSPTSSVRPAA